MLEELTLKNFKIFGEEGVTIRPGLVTVLIGPNGTGKSSVLQALGLMKQSIRQPGLKLDGPLVFGDYSDFQHKSTARKHPAITFGAVVRISQPIPPFFPYVGRFLYRASVDQNGLVEFEGEVEHSADKFLKGSWERRRPTKFQTTPAEIATEGGPSIRFTTETRQFAIPFQTQGRSAPEGTAYERSAEQLTCSLEDVLKRVYIAPALRGFDQLSYQQLPDPITDGDLLIYPTLDRRAQAVATILLQQREVEEKVAEWVSKVTQRTVGRRGARNYHIAVETSDSTARFNIVHEGFGTNQLIYMFTQIALAEDQAIVGIDEPEIHLHPAAQASLSLVLIDIAKSEGKQIILTTHSEHILMGLVTAVAQGKLKPEELAVYYFSREGDTARAERLEVTEQGQIKGGLKGFFEVEIEEMQRYMEALSQKNPS